MDRGAVRRTLNDELHMRKSCVKVVPKVPSDDQKQCRKDVCVNMGIPKVRQSSNLRLKLSGTTIHEGQELLCPSYYTRPLGAELHEQMSRFGGLSEERPLLFKTPSKLGTHFSTQCSGDERQSRPCPAR
ncbi:uncharacterized protein TNCV_2946171 [Trichonephila clavipes]|nr:uncharacterized protein TNCV_2946171 [Trichonephila clavipes]